MSQVGVWQDAVSEINLTAKMWLHWERLEKLLLLLFLTQKESFLNSCGLDNALFCSDN